VAGESPPRQSEGTAAPLAPGSLVAGYRVESHIGSGGMAMVWRATDEALGRTVALKVLPPAVAEDQEFRKRFIRESRAVVAVDHRHIIPVYAAGEADGVLYLAMRFIASGDLRAVVQREGPLSGDRTVALLSPIAAALDAAHAAGLVHRDVKPANILVEISPDWPEHPYLSDFGLAKGDISSVGLTGTGQFLGTPDYAAPEQIAGKQITARADQYALACVAYTALTGKLPFPRAESMAVLWAHMYDPPPSAAGVRPGLSADLDSVLARALAKAPEERYASCAEFTSALRAALSTASPADALTAPPASAPGARTPTAPAGLPEDPDPRPLTEAAATRRPLLTADLRKEPASDPPPAEGPYPPLASRTGLPADGDEQRPRWRNWRSGRRLAYVLAALVVLATVGGGGWWLTSGRHTTVPVPAVDKLTATAAEQALRQAGFQVRTRTPVTDDTVPKGEVLAVSPSGQAPHGTTVVLTISQGPEMITVPPVPAADTVAQAEAALRAAGLVVSAAAKPVDATSATVTIGAVAGTDPRAGTSWPENKPVAVEKVAGIALPSLARMKVGDVQALARRDQFALRVTQAASTTVPQGTVIAQSPKPGSVVTSGSRVSVSVSSGPPEVTIPNVTDESCQLAYQQLQQLGFGVSEDQETSSTTEALGTDPQAGQQAEQGSAVTLTCGTGTPAPTPTPTPTLTGPFGF
jgi:serine/threonine protein kinase/beta-lactam-binding protein with PASTA domain